MEVIGDIRKAFTLEVEFELLFSYNSQIIQQKVLLTLLPKFS